MSWFLIVDHVVLQWYFLEMRLESGNPRPEDFAHPPAAPTHKADPHKPDPHKPDHPIHNSDDQPKAHEKRPPIAPAQARKKDEEPEKHAPKPAIKEHSAPEKEPPRPPPPAKNDNHHHEPAGKEVPDVLPREEAPNQDRQKTTPQGVLDNKEDKKQNLFKPSIVIYSIDHESNRLYLVFVCR